MGYYYNKNNELTDAQDAILSVIIELVSASPEAIHKHSKVGIGKVMIQRHLKKLVELGRVIKLGKPPRVYYEVKPAEDPKIHRLRQTLDQIPISSFQEEVLGKFFAFATLTALTQGSEAFKAWFLVKQIPLLMKQKSKRKSFTEQMTETFCKLLRAYCDFRLQLEASRNEIGLFDATDRYLSIHKDQVLERVFCSDFYSIPQFGKTLLGCLTQKAKVGDRYSIVFIDQLISAVKFHIQKLLEDQKIEAILWVPHSLKRQVPLLDIMQKKINLTIPTIGIVKTFDAEIIPQKSISDLRQRIENAWHTNQITEPRSRLLLYKRIAIIDDAIGSNATIHAIAKKLKRLNSDLSINGTRLAV